MEDNRPYEEARKVAHWAMEAANAEAAANGVKSNAALYRKHVLALFKTLYNELAGSGGDGREANWSVDVSFWKARSSVGGVPGEYDEEIANNFGQGDTVNGLGGVCSLISGYVQDIHGYTPEGVSRLDLSKRIPTLRPSISRGGGTARMHIYYKDKEGRHYYAQAQVTRV